MKVSAMRMTMLEVGQNQDVIEGPCVLTDLIVSEITGSAPAMVVVSGVGGDPTYMMLSVPAGSSVLWHGALALSNGVRVASTAGDVAVTVGWA